MSDALLQLSDFSLERGDRVLFDHFSLQLVAGEIVQLAGANGTGKTSLMRSLVGLLQPQKATISWRGQEVFSANAYSDEILYLGHKPAVRFQLTPLENLRWYANLQSGQVDKRRDSDLMSSLKSLGLEGYEDEPCSQLSAGQKRRVGLARMAISKARLWVLDEPFTAVDVHGVKLLCEWIKAFAQQGGTVLFTTHQKVQFGEVLPRVVDLDALDTLSRKGALV
jgi:heme exporter protein A